MVLLRCHFEIGYGFSLEKIIPHYIALDGLDWFGLLVQLWSFESSHLMLVAFNVTEHRSGTTLYGTCLQRFLGSNS